MDKPTFPNPNDIIEYRCPKFGLVWQWRVLSVHLGATGQESLVELQSLHERAGEGVDGPMKTTWVPEPLLHGHKVIKCNPDYTVTDTTHD